MKLRFPLILLLLFATIGFTRCSVADEPWRLSAAQVQTWGEETLETIHRDFWLEDQGLYAERVGRRTRRPEPAFMWSAGVQLSALAAAADVNPDRYAARLATYAQVLQRYWVEHDGVSGFDVLPQPKEVDRYYDDNAWIVLGQLEAYEVTADRRYLDQAIDTFRFVLSGEDEVLGGGIYWREREKESKNTCSNAPAIVGALRLHQATGQQTYLHTARRLYDWTYANLQDRDSGLFLDNIALNGRIDSRKYSYNSALMIRANCLAYEVGNDRKYLDEARRMARAAEVQWVVPETGAMKDTGKFAHMLLEAFLEVQRHDTERHWIELVERCVTHLHRDLRDEQGHYPDRWDRPPRRPSDSLQLIDQASAARAYLTLARAKQRDRQPVERP